MTDGARRPVVRAKCVFCGGTPLSKEHVYPKWLRNTFGESDRVLTFLQVADGPVKPGKPTVPFDWTVKSVCRKCNSGWMSQLESVIEPILGPILRGQDRHLDDEDRNVLAVWVFKTFLMIHEQARTPPLVPRRHYTHLFHARTPPDQVRIWLAALGQPLDAPVVATRASVEHLEFEGTDDPDVPGATRFYGASISLGPFMACILGNIDTEFVPGIVGELSNQLVALWPASAAVVWPPAGTVEAFGGFVGVHQLLFEQPRDATLGPLSPWGRPDILQP